ncbi:MAG: hypothetical protein H8K05_00995 [Nitrospira sp.]|nr:hypothetical protein [Nitrospira sp.]
MIIPDDPLMILRLQLRELPCPACGAHELMPKLQCDYYPDGCLWFARCGHCQTQYHLDYRTVPADGPHAVGADIRHDAT